MAVLYQKFRPQTFEEVVGQEPIVQTLQNANKAGELAHAYLFTGSRGVGKTTIARLLAKAANCQNLKNGSPCGKCDICGSIANGSALDVIEIDAASHTGVDNVRELIEHAQFRPTSMQMKVFIIDEVHMLSKAAFNALLKTLEEPPKHAMFILATTDIEKVPDTITSRTQRFDFKRISSEVMANFLNSVVKTEKIKLPDGVVNMVVAQAEGSMRDALSRLGMVSSLGDKISLEDAQRLLGITSLESVQELIGKILSGDSAGLPEFFEITFSKGTDATVFNRSVLVYLQKILNAKLAGNNESNSDENLTNQSQQFTLQNLLFTIRLFLRSYKEINTSPSPELPLLLAAIEASMHVNPVSEPVVIKPTAVPAKVEPSKSTTQSNQPPVESNIQAAEEVAPVKEAPVVAKKESIIEPPSEMSGDIDKDVTIDQVKAWWPEIVNKVKVDNSPIATLLKNSPIVEVKDGKITIAVKYLFHKEHIDNKKHNAMIVERIGMVSGKNLIVKAVISKDVREPGISQTVDALADALKVFGGELVE